MEQARQNKLDRLAQILNQLSLDLIRLNISRLSPCLRCFRVGSLCLNGECQLLGWLYTEQKVRLARDGKASQAGLDWSGKARKAWTPPKGMRLVTKYGLLQSLSEFAFGKLSSQWGCMKAKSSGQNLLESWAQQAGCLGHSSTVLSQYGHLPGLNWVTEVISPNSQIGLRS